MVGMWVQERGWGGVGFIDLSATHRDRGGLNDGQVEGWV